MLSFIIFKAAHNLAVKIDSFIDSFFHLHNIILDEEWAVLQMRVIWKSHISLTSSLQKVRKAAVLSLWQTTRRSPEIKRKGKTLQLECSFLSFFFFFFLLVSASLPLSVSVVLSLHVPCCSVILRDASEGDHLLIHLSLASFCATTSLLSMIKAGLFPVKVFFYINKSSKYVWSIVRAVVRCSGLILLMSKMAQGFQRLSDGEGAKALKVCKSEGWKDFNQMLKHLDIPAESDFTFQAGIAHSRHENPQIWVYTSVHLYFMSHTIILFNIRLQYQHSLDFSIQQMFILKVH